MPRVLASRGAPTLSSALSPEQAAERGLDPAALCLRALEVAGAGVVVVDARGRPVLANGLARSWLDADLEDLRRRPLGRVTAWSVDLTTELQARALPLARALRGLPVDPVEIVLAHPDRSSRRVWITAERVHDDAGTPAGAIAVGWDLTAVRQQETYAARSAAQLSAMAGARRAVLADTEPREAVARSIVAVTGATCATVMEVQGDVMTITAQAGGPVPAITLRLDRPSVGAKVYHSGQALFLADVAADPALDVEPVDQIERVLGQRLHAACWVPIRAQHRVVGVLTAAFAVGSEAADDAPTTIRTMELLASEAALALERDDLRRSLATQALTDELTGLANLRAWRTALERMPRRGGLAIVDLDHFKSVNDSAGHAAGDRVLYEFAQALHETTRSEDLVARIGGEEFAVLCPIGEDVVGLIERLRNRWDGLSGAHPVAVTFSAGIAARGVDEPPEHTQARADKALYAAKLAGRDRSVTAALAAQDGDDDTAAETG